MNTGEVKYTSQQFTQQAHWGLHPKT